MGLPSRLQILGILRLLRILRMTGLVPKPQTLGIPTRLSIVGLHPKPNILGILRILGIGSILGLPAPAGWVSGRATGVGGAANTRHVGLG